MKISFYVYGNVQAVMFRKTFCLGALNRDLIGGATNDKEDRSRVLCSLHGHRDELDLFLSALVDLEKLNSWGAKVLRVEMLEFFKEIHEHEVTTIGFDKSSLSKEVKFYI